MRISHQKTRKARLPAEDFDPGLDDQQRPTRLLAVHSSDVDAILQRERSELGWRITGMERGEPWGLWIFAVRYLDKQNDVHATIRLLADKDQVFGTDGQLIARMANLPSLPDPERQLAEKLVERYKVLLAA